MLSVLGVLVFTALISWHRLWLENGLAHLDVPTFYLPWYAHLGEAVRALDIPGWNPYVFSGTPFAGDPQSGWWYLPAMAIFAVFEPVLAYQIYLIFHLALAGLTTYLLCRQLGLKPVAAMAGGVAYELGPLVSHISCCLIHVQLGAWVPTALLGVERTIRGRHWTERVLGWAIAGLAISQMLSGWPGQGAYNGLLVIGSYLAFRTLVLKGPGVLGIKDRVVRLVGDGAGILAMGFGLGAAGLLPRLDVVSRTNVAGGEYSGYEVDSYAAGWQVFTVLDRLFTDNNGFRTYQFYLGAPMVILAIAAIVLAWRRYWVSYFVALTVVTSILTLKPTFIHELFFLLPRFEELHSHVPSRILAVQWIAPSVLAATAVDALLRPRSRPRVLQAAVVPLAVWAFVTALLGSGGRTMSWNTIIAVVLTCILIALFVTVGGAGSARQMAFARKARVALAILLVLMVAWDPSGRSIASTLQTGNTMNPMLELATGPVSREAIEENAASTDPGGAGEYLQSRQATGEYFRYFGYDEVLQEGGRGYPSTYREHYANPLALALLVNARAMRLHLYDAQGYNPVQLVTYVDFLNEVNQEPQNYHDAQILPGGLTSPLLDLLNVRYVVIPNDFSSAGRVRPDLITLTASYTEVFRNEDVRVLQNPNAMPRAWIVHDVQKAERTQVADLIRSEAIDPRETVLVGPDVEWTVEGTPPTGSVVDSAEITQYEPDAIRLSVTSDGPGALVLSEAYDSGWHAWVNGEEAPVSQAYGVIRAVPIPAGDSVIELRYDPLSLRVGFGLSMGTALAVVGVAALWFVRRRREMTPDGA